MKNYDLEKDMDERIMDEEGWKEKERGDIREKDGKNMEIEL